MELDIRPKVNVLSDLAVKENSWRNLTRTKMKSPGRMHDGAIRLKIIENGDGCKLRGAGEVWLHISMRVSS